MKINRLVFFLSAGVALGVFGSALGGASEWSVLQHWKLGGSGGWDYLTLDPGGTRLFVSRGDHVDVVDTRAGTLIGTIPNTQGVHGIALSAVLKRGYTSNGKADSITAFDLDTLKVIKEVPVSGHNPDAIVYEPIGRHVFTFNGRSKDVSVLDAASLELITTFPVPDKPEFAVDDGAGHLYVNIESDAGQVVVIDSAKLMITKTWTLPGCAGPTGLALDPVRRRLFSVCDAHVMVVTDADTGRQVAQVKIGAGPDAAAFDSKRRLVFSANGEGSLTVARQQTANRYVVADNVATQRGARTMALDGASGRVYLVTADFDPAPPATEQQPHPRPVPVPGSFTILLVGQR